MSAISLLSKGPVDCGKLEKFADGCNAMARSFWQGHNVKLLKEGKDYSVQTEGGQTVTSRFVKAADSTLNLYPIGPIVGMIIMLAYALICVPVALTMGVGLIAKKIALATDEDSNRYQSFAKKYFALARQEGQLKQLSSKLKSKNEALEQSKKEINDLETIKVVGSEENAFKTILETIKETKKEELGKKINSTKSEIEGLNSDILSRTDRLNTLKIEVENLLKTYLVHKNERFEKINI